MKAAGILVAILMIVAISEAAPKTKKENTPVNQKGRKIMGMLTTTSIIFIAIYVLEATVITIGNTFTIFVFCTQTSQLKRSYFLLINLAVADLLVGIAEPIHLGTEKIPKLTVISPRAKESIKNPSAAFHLFASSTSVFFLALISLERAFAVLWPFRHRVISNTAYTCSIAIIWAAGFCVFGLRVLSMYHPKVDSKYVFVIIHSCLFISLLVICASYLKICNRLRSPAPVELNIHNRQSIERNLRLSRTTFLVTAVSLMFWLPAFVVYTMRDFCRPPCFPPIAVNFVNILHLANSMVNPFIYSFRMAIFKDALKKFSGRRRQEHIDVTPVQANRLGLSSEVSSTPKTQHTGAYFSGQGALFENVNGSEDDHEHSI